MKQILILFLLFFLFFPAVNIYASDLDIRTFTLFHIRERALSLQDEKREYLFYEYIDLNLRDIGREGLSISAYGWGRGASDLAFDETRDNSALSYAFLSYRAKKWDSTFKLGRIFSFSGSSFEQFDGFSASGNFIPGINLKVFGGSPVNYTPFIKGRGDLIYGTRLSHSFNGKFDIGVNYLREDDSSNAFREEAGVDLWLKPAKFIDLSGHVFYNNVTDHLSDYRALVLLRPHEKFTISTEFSEYIYSDYFFASPLSVFHFPDGEELQKFKVGIDASPIQKLSFFLDYMAFDFEKRDPADLYRAGVRFLFGDEGSNAGISFHRMDSDLTSQQYDEIQSFLFFKKKKYEGSLFLVGTFYEEAIFGVDDVYQVLASSGIRIKDNLTISADLQYDRNPEYENATTGMIRIKYNFSKQY